MGQIIDQRALAAHMAKLEQGFANTPPEVWAQVQRQHDIDKHNAAIDKRNAERRELRSLAKQARITLPALKRMLGK